MKDFLMAGPQGASELHDNSTDLRADIKADGTAPKTPAAPVGVTLEGYDAVNDVMRVVRVDATGKIITVGGGISPLMTEVQLELSTQSILSGVGAYISFNKVLMDELGAFNPVNPTRLTIPSSGIYIVGGFVEFDYAALGVRQIALNKNGNNTNPLAVQAQDAISAGIVSGLTLERTIGRFSVGDYIELQVYQTSGAPINVFSDLDVSPSLWLIKIR
jgi:hypothetical protein